MGDFVQTMKDWRRMCKHYSDESMKNGQLSCADMCPLGTNTACGVIEDATDRDIEVMVKEVAKWAAEHPEPVYPNWIDWLMSESVIPTNYMAANSTDSGVRAGMFYVTSKAFEPIPANIAEKLRIEPKEG